MKQVTMQIMGGIEYEPGRIRYPLKENYYMWIGEDCVSIHTIEEDKEVLIVDLRSDNVIVKEPSEVAKLDIRRECGIDLGMVIELERTDIDVEIYFSQEDEGFVLRIRQYKDLVKIIS